MAQRTIGDYESQEAARAQAVGALVEERDKMVLHARLYFCAQFTCFTSTNVQILTQLVEERENMVLHARLYLCAQFTCFTSTNVQILTQLGAQVRGADESIGNMRAHLQVRTLVGLA
jgi:hypothetical protein